MATRKPRKVGRPSEAGVARDKMIAIRLTADEAEAWEAAAERDGRPLSQWVRRIVSKALSR